MTRRGEYALATALVIGMFLAMWLASAVGYWLTGVPG